MSTDKNQTVHPVTDSVLIGHEGLTKREYFAAMAMQGILASPNSHFNTANGIAGQSVRMADILIDCLNQPK